MPIYFALLWVQMFFWAGLLDFFQELSFFSSLKVNSHVSHPCKITGTIVVTHTHAHAHTPTHTHTHTRARMRVHMYTHKHQFEEKMTTIFNRIITQISKFNLISKTKIIWTLKNHMHFTDWVPSSIQFMLNKLFVNSETPAIGLTVKSFMKNE
jgi:hypothetical protein